MRQPSLATMAIALVFAPGGAAACPPGVYLIEGAEGSQSLLPIEAAFADRRKLTGLLGYALTGGLASLKVKTVLLGAAAKVRSVQVRPTFQFCFEPPAASATEMAGSMGYVGVGAGAKSPHEYRLIRFETPGKNREVALSETNIGGPKSGAMAKVSVRFATVSVAPGIYRVTPHGDLAPGEYGFLHAAGSAALGTAPSTAPTERVYDFAVTG